MAKPHQQTNTRKIATQQLASIQDEIAKMQKQLERVNQRLQKIKFAMSGTEDEKAVKALRAKMGL